MVNKHKWGIMYGKIINEKLIIAQNQINTNTGVITRPTEQNLIDNSYKPIEYSNKPKYDYKEEKLIEKYIETEEKNIVDYAINKLTDEEHNEIINNEIRQKEELISVGLIATALVNNIKGTKDNSAITEIEKILSEIDSLKKELRGNK